LQADRETVRLSMPFGPHVFAKRPGEAISHRSIQQT